MTIRFRVASGLNEQSLFRCPLRGTPNKRSLFDWRYRWIPFVGLGLVTNITNLKISKVRGAASNATHFAVCPVSKFPLSAYLSHFLVNSRSKQLCVIEDFLFLRPSFSRSYRSILSSSLSRVYSITLVDLLLDHHCRFRVRFIFLCFFLSPSELKMRFNSHSLLINTLSIIRKTQNLFLCSHPIKLSLY